MVRYGRHLSSTVSCLWIIIDASLLVLLSPGRYVSCLNTPHHNKDFQFIRRHQKWSIITLIAFLISAVEWSYLYVVKIVLELRKHEINRYSKPSSEISPELKTSRNRRMKSCTTLGLIHVSFKLCHVYQHSKFWCMAIKSSAAEWVHHADAILTLYSSS